MRTISRPTAGASRFQDFYIAYQARRPIPRLMASAAIARTLLLLFLLTVRVGLSCWRLRACACCAC